MQGSQTFNEGPPKRLYRSRANRMISGICGGLGEYLNVDPVIIRIIFILLALFGGSGLLLYLIGIFIIPENPEVPQGARPNRSKKRNSAFWGWTLIILGALLLIPQFNIMPPINFWYLPWGAIWAVLFIILGLFLLLKTESQMPAQPSADNGAEGAPFNTHEPSEEKNRTEDGSSGFKTLHRSRKERMILGVCGGLAEYFNMDPVVVRLIFVLLTIFSKGLGILVYIILIFAMPDEKPQMFKDGDLS